MMGLLPEPILNKIDRDKHNLEQVESIHHMKMFKQHYDDILRYTKPVYGDKFQQININIPSKNMLVPLQKNIIEIDTRKTTQLDGEYSSQYRGKKYMKVIEADMNVKTKIDSFNFVYGITGGRRVL